MAEKSFGVKEVNLIGASGTPTITSPNNLNLNAVNVAISTNATVGGTLSVTGNVSVGGTLTYEDVTNIDAVGVITARAGIDCNADLDVDGHTNLDNVSVAGVTTFAGSSYFTNQDNYFKHDNATVRFQRTSSATQQGAIIVGNSNFDIFTHSGGSGGFRVYTGGAYKLSLNSSGTLTATTFSGSGASLTNLPAANLTGTLPAISGANLTNLPADTPTNSDIQVVYTVTANGSSAYRFAGNGVVSTADDPDLYLIRGQKYRFINNSGGSHPFQIREASGGTAYSTGVTNNGAASGNIDFAPTYDSPAQLVYQCTSHGGMVGNIYLRDAAGNNTNVGVTTFADNVSIIKSGGPILELCNNTNSTTMALRLHEGTAGSTANGGGMTYDGSANKLHITCGVNLTTNRITILRDDGKVGIGTDNPSSLLTLDHATNPSIQFKDSGTKVASINSEGTSTNIASFESKDLLFACSASSAFTERLRIASDGTIHVNSSDSASGGRIYATGSALYLQSGNGRQTLKVSDASAGVNRTIEMTSAGNLKFPLGTTIGIDFSAKTNLSGATDTTLAHYEEGTWTPTLINLDVPGHVTTDWATYTRVGRVVTISVKFSISSSVNDASGFGFSLPYGPISDRQIVIPAISDRSGSSKAPFAFINILSDHNVYAKRLDGFAFQSYNLFSGNYIIVTGSYETDA